MFKIKKQLFILAITAAAAASSAAVALEVRAEEGAKTVVIESYAFKPEQIRVKKGTQITFVNKDAAPHTVSPVISDEFEGSGRLLKNEQKSIVFDHVGNIRYYCNFHPSMEGVVVVTEK